MAKRFTDTEIWDKEWFMLQSPKIKCLIKYVFDRCDIAGVWNINILVAGIYIGEPVTVDELLAVDNGRHFIRIKENKIFIPDFIRFQYGQLSMSSRVHKAVCDLLIKHGISEYIAEYLKDSEDLPTAKRKRITEHKQNEIFALDYYTCQYCGGRPEKYNLNIDHIVPIERGGDNEDDNLTTICVSCNSRKRDMDVFEFIKKFNITPLDRLSKKLHTLSKILDSPKDKDKDKDIKDSKEEESNNVEIQEILKMLRESKEGFFISPEDEKFFIMIVLKIAATYKEFFPHYFFDQETDYPACLKIAYKIAEINNWHRDSVLNGNMDSCLSEWRKILQVVVADKWFSTRSLSDLATVRELQRIINTINYKNETTKKSFTVGRDKPETGY